MAAALAAFILSMASWPAPVGTTLAALTSSVADWPSPMRAVLGWSAIRRTPTDGNHPWRCAFVRAGWSLSVTLLKPTKILGL